MDNIINSLASRRKHIQPNRVTKMEHGYGFFLNVQILIGTKYIEIILNPHGVQTICVYFKGSNNIISVSQ